MTAPSGDPDAASAIEKYRSAAGKYDRATRRADRLRTQAVARLRLTPGERVLDVACGTGTNFEMLREAVGPSGHVVGTDVSAYMLAKARERIARHGWNNVTLVDGRADEVDLGERADAALFSLTHDVLQARDAVANVLSQLRPGARVVALGAKWAPAWALPVNAVVWWTARPYVTTFAHFSDPWHLLAEVLPDLRVESVAFGGAYIASGTLDAASPPER